MVGVSGLQALVEEVMDLGVLTSDMMYQIDQILRQRNYNAVDMNALDRLLQALIAGQVRSQSPSVNLFLAYS